MAASGGHRHESIAPSSPFPQGGSASGARAGSEARGLVADLLEAAVRSRLLFRHSNSHFGLRPADLQLLLAIWRWPGLAVRELADLLALSDLSAQNGLARLRQEGYIRARSDLADERWKLQYVTEDGAEAVNRFLAFAEADPPGHRSGAWRSGVLNPLIHKRVRGNPSG